MQQYYPSHSLHLIPSHLLTQSFTSYLINPPTYTYTACMSLNSSTFSYTIPLTAYFCYPQLSLATSNPPIFTYTAYVVSLIPAHTTPSQPASH